MTVEQYCKQCNAPHKPLEAVMMRCGLCAVINGKLPPTKYQPKNEQPAQPLPFGVGGGLVAIKTLLSRDPCVHASTAIQMIDAILAGQQGPAEPVACKTLCELCVKRGYTFCANAVKTTPINTPPQRKPLSPQSPCEMTQAERKMFKLGWLECEAAQGIKENT